MPYSEDIDRVKGFQLLLNKDNIEAENNINKPEGGERIFDQGTQVQS